MGFRDRQDAGRQLAVRISALGLTAPVVVALPRGGVPVAAEVAKAIGAPLDVLVVRKIGAPQQRELGIGAVAEGGVVVALEELVRRLGVGQDQLEALRAEEESELDRRVHRYRGDRPMADVRGREVVLVDDGLATGVTALAAIEAMRRLGPGRLVLAVPVCAPDTARQLGSRVDDLVCVEQPTGFTAVGVHYTRFDQVPDDEVVAALDAGRTVD